MDNQNMQRRIEHLEKALRLVGIDYKPRPERAQLTEKERLELAAQLAKVRTERSAAVGKILSRINTIEKRLALALDALYAIGRERDAANGDLRNTEHDFDLRQRPFEVALREGAPDLIETVIPERINAERSAILRAMESHEPVPERTLAMVLLGNDEAAGIAAQKRRERLNDRAEKLNDLAAMVSTWHELNVTDKELEGMLESKLSDLPTIGDRKAAN